MLNEYEKYLKAVAQGQKDTAKAQLDEKQRQLDLAAQQNEKDAHSQIAGVKAAGSIGAEQRRILDSMTGYQGSGAAVQNQINAALSTDSATGRIHEALARARGDITNQRASNLAAYNTGLADIDNQVAAALAKAKYEQLLAAAQPAKPAKQPQQIQTPLSVNDNITKLADRALKLNTKDGVVDTQGVLDYIKSNSYGDTKLQEAVKISAGINEPQYKQERFEKEKANNKIAIENIVKERNSRWFNWDRPKYDKIITDTLAKMKNAGYFTDEEIAQILDKYDIGIYDANGKKIG